MMLPRANRTSLRGSVPDEAEAISESGLLRRPAEISGTPRNDGTAKVLPTERNCFAVLGVLKNLVVMGLSLVVVFGTIELCFRKFGGMRTNTYFDDQTEQALGSPMPRKEPGEYRIFIFGGSAAYGFPLSDRYSITAWLRKSFSYLLPEKKVEVINCAWPGRGSHHVLMGARSVLKYEPDLFIIYSGHNDGTTVNRLYVDNRLYGLTLRLKYESAFYRYLSLRLNRLRKHIVYGKSGFPEKQYREEVIAGRVYQKTELTEEDYERILGRYRKNFQEVLKLAKSRQINVLLLTLPSNVREVPPAASTHRSGLSESEKEEWDRFYQEGIAEEVKGNFSQALESYQRAEQIDATHAELQYRLGRSLERAGDFASAKRALILARDLDRRPWRAKSFLNDVVRELALESPALLVDLEQEFEAASPHGIVGKELIHDDVHPSHAAQQLIAFKILRVLSEQGKIARREKWQWEALDQARGNPDSEEWNIPHSLDAYEYVLRGLHLWQQGRYQELVPDLEKGLELMPSFLESYGFLADAYWHLGDREKAVEAFQAFKTKDPQAFQLMLKRYPDLRQSYTQVNQAVQTPSGRV